jgi:diguanylate cyclase (GGDEF)-like protein
MMRSRVRSPTGEDSTADARQRATGRRDQSAQARLQAADGRDAVAHARDLAAFTRDAAADARNLELAWRDGSDEDEGTARVVSGSEVMIVAAARRKRAARYHEQAVEHDARAAEDRHDAAADREQAAYERLHALVDRELLADALAQAANDALTGARARAAGLAELACEIDRCRRTSGQLVVAYLDVVGLKALNDSQGHAAGDALLILVVSLVENHLRSYDLIVRVGGDEFVCAMSNMTLADARERFGQVAAALSAASGGATIRYGLARLTPHESATELVARADRELIAGPHSPH